MWEAVEVYGFLSLHSSIIAIPKPIKPPNTKTIIVP